jgi:putative acetyltransferase
VPAERAPSDLAPSELVPPELVPSEILLPELVMATEDPRAEDVTALLERHLAFAREVTPAGHVHALQVERLVDPSVTFFTARREGRLVGVGALRRLDGTHAELKSMHTSEAARGQGVGRAMVTHILTFAASSGYERVSLETGTMEAFASARSLYEKAGFVECEPFGDYTTNPFSTCMTISIGPGSIGPGATDQDRSGPGVTP